MFNFIVKYLGFFKQVPLLPLVFDSQLRLYTLITNYRALATFGDIEAEVLSWPGMSIGLHRYRGTQFNFKGKEIGHLHSGGMLNIRFSRAIKQKLMADGKISEHHVFPQTGWMSFKIRGGTEGACAIALLKLSRLMIIKQR